MSIQTHPTATISETNLSVIRTGECLWCHDQRQLCWCLSVVSLVAPPFGPFHVPGAIVPDEEHGSMAEVIAFSSLWFARKGGQRRTSTQEDRMRAHNSTPRGTLSAARIHQPSSRGAVLARGEVTAALQPNARIRPALRSALFRSAGANGVVSTTDPTYPGGAQRKSLP